MRFGEWITAVPIDGLSIPSMHQPQQDIVLTREPSDKGAIPVSSVALIVEVSDSSSRYDYRPRSVA